MMTYKSILKSGKIWTKEPKRLLPGYKEKTLPVTGEYCPPAKGGDYVLR
jgi:hypothetical protein